METVAETVVQIKTDEAEESSQLCQAVDAFAKWSLESGLMDDAGGSPDIMMMTDYSDGAMSRKLVFQSREQAARFLTFWRNERTRLRHPILRAGRA